MINPPKRIRVVIDKDNYSYTCDKNIDELNIKLQCLAPFTEHFYTLEEKEKPMEQKKEMTDQDAWIAMAKGECVDTEDGIHTIKDNRLFFWNNQQQWIATSILNDGPYSIVPNPSRLEVKVDRYIYQRDFLLDDARKNGVTSVTIQLLIDIIDKHLQRKEVNS